MSETPGPVPDPEKDFGGVEGRVIDLLPQAKFRVELASNNAAIVAHVAATAERNFMRLRVGDRVTVLLSPHDATRGRIVQVIRPV